MRQPSPQEVRRSHLQPCPRCGEANGVTALACWKCDLQLMPDHLLASRPAGGRTPPASNTVPRIDTEVPAEELQQIQASRFGPPTLPPFASRTDAATANDPQFGSPWSSPHFRLLWAAVGLALAAALLAWLVPRGPAARPGDVPSSVSTAPANPAAPAAPPAAATPAPTAQATPSARPAAPLPAAPAVAAQTQGPSTAPPAAVAAPAEGRAAPAGATPSATPAVAAVAPPATPRMSDAVAPESAGVGGAPTRAGRSSRAATPAVSMREQAPGSRQQAQAARRIDAQAERQPAPVQAPCTPQVAALGLCTPQ